jgi:hypothetical protein
MAGLRLTLILCPRELIMASAEIVGILQERHPHHIVLGNGILISLRAGVSANHVAIGRSFTANCTVLDGSHVTSLEVKDLASRGPAHCHAAAHSGSVSSCSSRKRTSMTGQDQDRPMIGLWTGSNDGCPTSR